MELQDTNIDMQARSMDTQRTSIEMEIISSIDVPQNERGVEDNKISWKTRLGRFYVKVQFQTHFFLTLGVLGLIAAGAALMAKKDKQISPQAFTSILLAEQLIVAVMKPLLGFVADYTRKLKGIILVLTMIQVLAYPTLYHLPPISEETLNLNATGASKEDSTHSLWQDYKTREFWLFAIVFMMMDVTGNAIVALSDAACYESVLKTGADFGRHRMWGAIGFGLFAPIGGVLNHYDPSYMAIYIVFFFAAMSMLINLVIMDMHLSESSENTLKDFLKLFKSKKFLSLELGLIFNGIGMGIFQFKLIWFVGKLGGTQLIFRLMQFIQYILGELPSMYISTNVMKKMGYMNILSTSYITYSLMFGIYSQVQNLWFLLPVEWLHGLANGVFYTAMIMSAKKYSKEGSEITTQAVVSATYNGIGSGLGCIVGGMAFHFVDMHKAFLYFTILFGVIGIGNHIITMVALLKRKVYKISPYNEINNTPDIQTTSFCKIPL